MAGTVLGGEYPELVVIHHELHRCIAADFTKDGNHIFQTRPGIMKVFENLRQWTELFHFFARYLRELGKLDTKPVQSCFRLFGRLGKAGGHRAQGGTRHGTLHTRIA